MDEYTKPLIRIINEDDKGTIYISPTIMFHIQGSNVSYLNVDIYLDNKKLCFDSFRFDTYAWDFVTFKQYTYTISEEVWEKIYDGSHKIIFVVTDSNNMTAEAEVVFVRSQNPFKEGCQTLVPSNPSRGDNEAVKIGGFHCTRKSLRDEANTKTVVINQFSSYGFCTPNNHFDGIFDVPGEDVFGDDDRLLVKRGPRDNNGWLKTPVSTYNERIYFAHTDDELKKWSWVKTSMNGKIFYISTTAAPTDFLHPTSNIDIYIDGLTYKLRCLTQKEWMSIDEFTLEKVDFGNYMMNAWHSYKIITSTKHNDLDKNVLKNDEEIKYYNERLKGKAEENYVCMIYVNKAKAEAMNCRSGWSQACPIRPDFDDNRYDVFWIPVLELINDVPVIVLPDKNKDNPVIYL